QNLDGDMPQYISDNTDDEISHRDFLNAYLKSKGAQPIDFHQFEILQPTKAAGALGNGRLTNLQKLTVDTSWYFRYRSTQNPDLGAKFPQLINIANQPAIPCRAPPGQAPSRRSPTSRGSISHTSSRADRACIRSWPSRPRALRFSAF